MAIMEICVLVDEIAWLASGGTWGLGMSDCPLVLLLNHLLSMLV
jgi:hypothetical protein